MAEQPRTSFFRTYSACKVTSLRVVVSQRRVMPLVFGDEATGEATGDTAGEGCGILWMGAWR